MVRVVRVLVSPVTDLLIDALPRLADSSGRGNTVLDFGGIA